MSHKTPQDLASLQVPILVTGCSCLPFSISPSPFSPPLLRLFSPGASSKIAHYLEDFSLHTFPGQLQLHVGLSLHFHEHGHPPLATTISILNYDAIMPHLFFFFIAFIIVTIIHLCVCVCGDLCLLWFTSPNRTLGQGLCHFVHLIPGTQ